MVQHFMLWALIANVLFSAVCAYCLTIVVRHLGDSKELRVFGKISQKVAAVGGLVFLVFLGYASIMLYWQWAYYVPS